MDIISRAIINNKHICDRINTDKQTWDFFDKSRNGKKLFVLGVGGGEWNILSAIIITA